MWHLHWLECEEQFYLAHKHWLDNGFDKHPAKAIRFQVLGVRVDEKNSRYDQLILMSVDSNGDCDGGETRYWYVASVHEAYVAIPTKNVRAEYRYGRSTRRRSERAWAHLLHGVELVRAKI